jgi:hypothetical protein
VTLLQRIDMIVDEKVIRSIREILGRWPLRIGKGNVPV